MNHGNNKQTLSELVLRTAEEPLGGFRQNSRTFQMLSPLGSFLVQVASLLLSYFISES